MLPTFSRSCSGMLYAFEPVFENYTLAKLFFYISDLENVMLFNAGLGSELSCAHINTGDSADTHRGGASFIDESGQIAPLMTIDCLGLKQTSIIQLDVEGFELEALKGAEETIKRNEPVIMIEDNDRICDPFLKSLGYDFVGTIPGLFIWARQPDMGLLKDLI